ncbi:fungal-specific transcription factor domain-containing protein [Aspergillus germanicus]
MSDTSSAVQRPRSKRAPTACEYCHQRKTRCDLVHVSPCTNCRLDKIPCVRRPPRKPSMTPRSRPRLTTKNIDHSTHSALGLTLATERPGSPRSQEFPPANINRLPFSYYVLLNGAPLGRLDENEIAILESRGCLHLPSRPVTESLIVHYFLYIHPSLPILDEPEFWRMYSRPEEYSGQFSLTLFQAMLFAAAPFVPEYVVRQCGFDSLLAAREALYCRAKLLQSQSLDSDHVVSAQIALLLSFYNSNTDLMSNSNWLTTAIDHAQANYAHKHSDMLLLEDKRRKLLKRLWWSCVLRDRMISMGMRRPLQIPPSRFRTSDEPLCLADLQDEVHGSAVYTADVKLSLAWLFIRLCHFTDAVTELLSILYPPPGHNGERRANTAEADRVKLQCARANLAIWDMDFSRVGEEDVLQNHSSVILFSHLNALYYQTARIALCNHACQHAARFDWCNTSLSLDYYKGELQEAFSAMTEQVRNLVAANMAKYLPVSAMAYTVLPLILWGINVTLSSTPTARHRNSQGLALFTAVNRSYSLRYDVKRLAMLVDRALHFAKMELVKLRPFAGNIAREISFLDMFEQEPASYVALYSFLDTLLSADFNHAETRPRRADAPSNVATQSVEVSSSAPGSVAKKLGAAGLDVVIPSCEDHGELAPLPQPDSALDMRDLSTLDTIESISSGREIPIVSNALVSQQIAQEAVQPDQFMDFWGVFGE